MPFVWTQPSFSVKSAPEGQPHRRVKRTAFGGGVTGVSRDRQTGDGRVVWREGVSVSDVEGALLLKRRQLHTQVHTYVARFSNSESFLLLFYSIRPGSLMYCLLLN